MTNENDETKAPAKMAGQFPGGSQTIAGMFMAILERELGDAGFVQLAKSFRNHTVVLFLGRARER